MRRVRGWNELRIVAATAVMLGMLSALPGAAAPPAGPPPRREPGPGGVRAPMPMLMAQRDPELTGLVRDIVILRAINGLGMTLDQTKKLIPALEQVAAAERHLRDEALRQLRAERARLLVGSGTDEGSRDARKALAAVRSEHAAELDRIVSQISGFLSADQVGKLKKLAMGGARREGRPREPGWGGESPGGPGASSEVIQRVVELLKEKVKAMSAASR